MERPLSPTGRWRIVLVSCATIALLAAADTPIPPPGAKWGDEALADAATLAGNNTRVLLDALAADIRAHGRPTREGATAAFAGGK